MKRLLTVAFVTLTLVSATSFAEIGTIRRPIDNFIGNWLDHTYTVNDSSFACYESFGGGCDCAGNSDCTWLGWGNSCGSDANATTCGNWISGNWTYGSQGVCHQASANENWYATCADLSTAWGGKTVRGLSISNGMFGTWGTNYSGCP
jgi:hypothetical protein